MMIDMMGRSFEQQLQRSRPTDAPGFCRQRRGTWGWDDADAADDEDAYEEEEYDDGDGGLYIVRVYVCLVVCHKIS